MRYIWTAVKHATIDKSMIKYMGISVTNVHYMSANPIKHGIKVFAVCFFLSAIILSFKVYVGQEDYYDNTDLEIFDELVKESRVTSVRGRTICTNNYYTPMVLAKNTFNKYG